MRRPIILSLVILMWAPAAAAAETSPGPCAAFLIPAGADIRERPSATARTVRTAPAVLVGLPALEGHFAYSDIVQVSASEVPEAAVGCFNRDFGVDGPWLKLRISPETFSGEVGWVRLEAVEAFSYPYPGKWRKQNPNATLASISRAAAAAKARSERFHVGSGAPSARATIRGAEAKVWADVLEALVVEGWEVESANREAGLVTSKLRVVPARTATSCPRTDSDEEKLRLTLVVVPGSDGAEIRAALSFVPEGACHSWNLLEEGYLARLQAIAGR